MKLIPLEPHLEKPAEGRPFVFHDFYVKSILFIAGETKLAIPSPIKEFFLDL